MSEIYNPDTNDFEPLDLSKLDVKPYLRGYLGSKGQDFPLDLIGAEIINIGCVFNLENGFVIDYLPKNSNQIERLVMCSTELGMWIEGKANL